MANESKGLLVRPTVAPPIERALKRAVLLLRCDREQRCARPKLHIIGRAENRMERSRLDLEYRPRAEIEPWPEYRVREIGARLGERADAVILGVRGTAVAAQLRKDEPHPVRPLSARP